LSNGKLKVINVKKRFIKPILIGGFSRPNAKG